MSDPLALLRALLPEEVVAAGGLLGQLQAPLFPAEQAALSRARDARRKDFTAGRSAARQALAALGLPSVALPADPRGPAIWPAGVAGSITHGAGWALAAAGPASRFRGIGIDIEAAGVAIPLAEIAQPAEISALGNRDPVVLFSAKEAVYKAQFPLTGRMLEFRDLGLAITDSAFTARFLHDVPPIMAGMVIHGLWSAGANAILTFAAVRA